MAHGRGIKLGLGIDIGSGGAGFNPDQLVGVVDEWQAAQKNVLTRDAVIFDTNLEALNQPAPTAAMQGDPNGWWMSFWIRADVSPAGNIFSVTTITGSFGWAVRWLTTDTLQFWSYFDTGQVDTLSGIPLAIGVWTHIYYEVIPGTHIRCRQDDATDFTAASTDTTLFRPATDRMQVIGNGVTPVAYQSLCGGSGVLSPSEITALYNAGAGHSFESAPGSVTSKATWWFELNEPSGNRLDKIGAGSLIPNLTPGVTDGNTLVPPVDGNRVEQWIGSINGTVLEQAVAAAQPLWIAVAQNGQPTVRFDGAATELDAIAFGSIAQPNTVYSVSQLTTPATSSTLYDATPVGDRNDIFGNATVYNVHAGSVLASTTPTDTLPLLLTAIFNGVSSVLRANAVQTAAGDAGAQAMGSLRLGSNNGGLNHHIGDIAHFIVQNALATAQEIDDTEAYLNALYDTYFALAPGLVDEWISDAQYCETDAALNLVAANTQYLTNAASTFQPLTKLTARFTVNPATAHNGRVVQGEGNSWVIRVNSAQKAQMFFDGTAIGVVSLTNLAPAAGPYDITVVYDGDLAPGSRVAFYFNGVLDTGAETGTVPATITNLGPRMDIGQTTGFGSQPFNGTIQALGLTANALTGADLTAAHIGKFFADMTTAEKASWDHFYNLTEETIDRADSAGSLPMSPVAAPGAVAGSITGPVTNGSKRSKWIGRRFLTELAAPDFAAQPLWQAAAVGPALKPGALFDGSLSHERTTDAWVAATFQGNQLPYTMFIVMTETVVASATQWYASVGSAIAANRITHGAANTTFHGVRRRDVTTTVTESGAIARKAGATLVTVIFDGATLEIHVDGVFDFNRSFDTLQTNVDFTQFALGAEWATSVTSFWDGHIAYFAILDNAGLSAERLQEIELAVMGEYGII